MISPDELRERQKQWDLFHRWEARQPCVERDPADIVADIGAILDWLPPEILAEDPDPEKRGIQIMRAAFELLKTRV